MTEDNKLPSLKQATAALRKIRANDLWRVLNTERLGCDFSGCTKTSMLEILAWDSYSTTTKLIATYGSFDQWVAKAKAQVEQFEAQREADREEQAKLREQRMETKQQLLKVCQQLAEGRPVPASDLASYLDTMSGLIHHAYRDSGEDLLQ